MAEISADLHRDSRGRAVPAACRPSPPVAACPSDAGGVEKGGWPRPSSKSHQQSKNGNKMENRTTTEATGIRIRVTLTRGNILAKKNLLLSEKKEPIDL